MKVTTLITAFLSMFLIASPLLADGSRPKPRPKPTKKVDIYTKGYNHVQKLKKQEEQGTLSGAKLVYEYKRSKTYFIQSLKKRQHRPESFNMLAYCQRKSGNFDDAIKNYKKALKLKPKFPEAREYLGEAYVQLALKQARILKGYGRSGEHALEDLTESMEDALKELK